MDELPKKQPNRRTQPREWLDGYVPPQRFSKNAGTYFQKPAQPIDTKPQQRAPQANHPLSSPQKLRRRPPRFNKKKTLVPVFFLLVLVSSLVGTTFFTNPQKVEAAITFRSSSGQTRQGTASSFTFDNPGTAANYGDIMVVTIAVDAGTNTTITATGWTVVGADCSNGTSVKVSSYRREYTSGDGATYSFSFNTSRLYSAGFNVYGGVNRTTPIDNAGSCTNSATLTGLTPNVANTFLVGGIGHHNNDSGGATISPPASMTGRSATGTTTNCTILCTNNNISVRVADELRTNTSATGTRTFTTNGGGATWIGRLFTLNPAADPTLTQSAYRWLTNNDAANPTTELAANNTALSNVKVGDTMRLRILLDVTIAELQSNLVQFKLRFAPKGAGCSSATYSDVSTSSGAIQFKNITPADGADISTTAVDPSHSTHTNIPHTFEEANNFATRQITASGQDAMWDFALTNASAPNNTTYCFKITNSDNSDINGGYSVYPELTSINISYEASAYRWLTNADSTTPGSAMAAQDTGITNVKVGDKFRLRMLIHNGGTDSIPVNYENLKLQFAVMSGGSCASTPTGDYGDVATGAGAIRYFNNTNAGATDGASISTVADDPSHSGHTRVAETYEEANNFTTPTAIPGGQDGLWDFSLTNDSAPLRTTYCFRAVKSDGILLTSYDVRPQITTQDPRYEEAAYRWLTNADNITPGSALAANNAPVTDIGQNVAVRLRMLIHVSNDAQTTGLESFKLRFAQKVGATCDLTSPDESYSDLVSGSGAFRYNNNASVSDNASISTTANDPSHGSDTIVTQVYRESNNFTSISQIPVDQDGMWDFAIINNSAAQNTTWCFKITDTSNNDLNSGYTQIAELSTAPAAMNQSAYRWFQNINIADMLTITENPTASATDAINDTAIDTTAGYIYLAGHENSKWRIEKRKSSNAELCTAAECGTAFDTDGIINEDIGSSADEKINAIAIDASGGYMYLAGYDSAGASSTPQWRIEKRNLSDGALVTAFDTDGIITEDIGSSADEKINAIAIDASGGHMYLVGYDSAGANSGQQWRIEKRNLSDGALVTAFDTDGIIIEDLASGGTKAEQLTAAVLDVSGGNLYAGGFDGSPPGAGSSTWRVEKRSMSSGAFGSGFGNHDSTDCNNNGSGTAVYCVDPQGGGGSDDRLSDLAIDSTYIFMTGSDTGGSGGQWRVDRITLSDNTITAQLVNENPSGGVDIINDLYSDGTYLFLVGYDSADTDKQWRIEKRKASNGNLCTAAECGTGFDTDGIIQVNPSGTLDDEALTTTIDTTNSRIYTAGFDQTPASGDTQWRIEKRKTSDGSRGWEPPNALVAQDTKVSLSSLIKFRLRMLIHISGENMPINGETLKLRYAPKIGTCDSGGVGEVYVDVPTSGGDISYYNNTNIGDADASSSIEGDPSHSGHTNVPETYEEANTFTFPVSVSAGQDGLWDFALIDNNAFGNYCFKVTKSDNTDLATYSVIPEVVFCDRPKAANVLRHGSFFCDDSRKQFYWN